MQPFHICLHSYSRIHLIIYLNFTSETHLKYTTVVYKKINVTIMKKAQQTEIKFLASVGVHNDLPAAEI